MKIGILDYGAGGNIASIKSALNVLDINPEVTTNIDNLDKLIIPGVGSYKKGSKFILDYKEEVFNFSKEKKLLGICLGMQILCRKGFEFGSFDGVNIIDGECVQINTSHPLPHVGWSTIDEIKSSKLLKGIKRRSFYFTHSYEVINYTDSVALADYHGHKIVSVIEKNNIFGVQFHPERSGESGLKLLNNFINL